MLFHVTLEQAEDGWGCAFIIQILVMPCRAYSQNSPFKMSLDDFNQLQNFITAGYALVMIFSPLKKSWLAVGLVGISALMGLLPV